MPLIGKRLRETALSATKRTYSRDNSGIGVGLAGGRYGDAFLALCSKKLRRLNDDETLRNRKPARETRDESPEHLNSILDSPKCGNSEFSPGTPSDDFDRLRHPDSFMSTKYTAQKPRLRQRHERLDVRLFSPLPEPVEDSLYDPYHFSPSPGPPAPVKKKRQAAKPKKPRGKKKKENDDDSDFLPKTKKPKKAPAKRKKKETKPADPPIFSPPPSVRRPFGNIQNTPVVLPKDEKECPPRAPPSKTPCLRNAPVRTDATSMRKQVLLRTAMIHRDNILESTPINETGKMRDLGIDISGVKEHQGLSTHATYESPFLGRKSVMPAQSQGGKKEHSDSGSAGCFYSCQQSDSAKTGSFVSTETTKQNGNQASSQPALVANLFKHSDSKKDGTSRRARNSTGPSFHSRTVDLFPSNEEVNEAQASPGPSSYSVSHVSNSQGQALEISSFEHQEDSWWFLEGKNKSSSQVFFKNGFPVRPQDGFSMGCMRELKRRFAKYPAGEDDIDCAESLVEQPSGDLVENVGREEVEAMDVDMDDNLESLGQERLLTTSISGSPVREMPSEDLENKNFFLNFSRSSDPRKSETPTINGSEDLFGSPSVVVYEVSSTPKFVPDTESAHSVIVLDEAGEEVEGQAGREDGDHLEAGEERDQFHEEKICTPPVFKIPAVPMKRVSLKFGTTMSPGKALRHRSSMKLGIPKLSVSGACTFLDATLVPPAPMVQDVRQSTRLQLRSSAVPVLEEECPSRWLSLASKYLRDPRVAIEPGEARMLLSETSSTGLTSFTSYISDLTHSASKQKKIGEGTYGEVFMVEFSDEVKKVVKIAPVDGTKEINGTKPKPALEMAMEVLITGVLSDLRKGTSNRCTAFVELLNVAYVNGKYPKKLLTLWDKFKKENECWNERPHILPKGQGYISMELAHGGRDLENYPLKDLTQGLSVFEQVAAALATGELAYEFEHRDLHWGNILLQPTDKADEVFNIGGNTLRIPNHGIRVTIIDYSLSRLQIPGGSVMFNDLSEDPPLFENYEDPDIQFQVYRDMRDVCGDDWTSYCPKTNTIWLEYLRRKLLHFCSYSETKTEEHVLGRRKLRSYGKNLEEANSAHEFVFRSFEGIRTPLVLLNPLGSLNISQ